ncbi:MAG: hypothetical protein ACC646_12720, partial [Paracoccaceae bacterium]
MYECAARPIFSQNPSIIYPVYSPQPCDGRKFAHPATPKPMARAHCGSMVTISGIARFFAAQGNICPRIPDRTLTILVRTNRATLIPGSQRLDRVSAGQAAPPEPPRGVREN